ncbi:MAG TPA: hypothetical protein VHY48_04635 [Acidobacteriaceae bacterium]|jgi:hypothetical protein|nr:hypothetical protein [Acidobacteriaceae bacterium]
MTASDNSNKSAKSAPAPTETSATFPANWTAEILRTPPLIAPARQVTWPQRVAGEEDALARGALLVLVKPASGGAFLATCALGFRDPSLPSGIWPCPRRDDLLAVAGGYAYLVDTRSPDQCLHLPLRPVTQVLPAPQENLILLAGFHTIAALGASGLLWETARLSWEGLTLNEIRDGQLHGLGWNMPTDRELPFTVDLRTGSHTGGGFERETRQ